MLSGIGRSVSGVGLGFWGWKFKTEVLAGIVGVSAAAGSAAFASNDVNIKSFVSQVFDPVKTNFDNYLVPQLTKLRNGVTQISNVFAGWSRDIFDNEILKWFKEQELKNISKGFFVLAETFRNWSENLNSFVEKLLGSKEMIEKFLNKEKIAKILTVMSEFSSAIKAALSTFSSLIFMATQNFLSPSSSKGQDSEDSLKKILSSGKVGQFFSSVWDVVTENPEAIKTINSDQVKRLFTYAASNMDLFVSRVASLKESASKTTGNTTGWGKYPTSVELMNAIMDNRWGNLFVGFLNVLVSPFSSCKQGQNCSTDHVFHDTVKALVETIKNN